MVTQNPLAQKGRKSEHQPWFFGIRFALLIATWDIYRLPVAFRVIRRKTDPTYQTENALFREMVRQFVPPAWATRVIVEGDAAYGSQDNMKMVVQRDANDPTRRWGFVFAIARTWKTVEDKAIKDLVTHLPRKYYQRTRSGAIYPLSTQAVRLQRRRKLLGLGHLLRLQGSIEVLHLVVQRVEPTRLFNGWQKRPVQLQALCSQGPKHPLRIDNPSHNARLHVPCRSPGSTSANSVALNDSDGPPFCSETIGEETANDPAAYDRDATHLWHDVLLTVLCSRVPCPGPSRPVLRGAIAVGSGVPSRRLGG
jgi:hypothetical protein